MVFSSHERPLVLAASTEPMSTMVALSEWQMLACLAQVSIDWLIFTCASLCSHISQVGISRPGRPRSSFNDVASHDCQTCQIGRPYRCARQTALEGQDLSRTYLAHHEQESVVITIITNIIIRYASPRSRMPQRSANASSC